MDSHLMKWINLLTYFKMDHKPIVPTTLFHTDMLMNVTLKHKQTYLENN